MYVSQRHTHQPRSIVAIAASLGMHAGVKSFSAEFARSSMQIELDSQNDRRPVNSAHGH